MKLAWPVVPLLALPALAQSGPDQWGSPEGLPFVVRIGSVMVQTDADTLYIAVGDYSGEFYKVSISTGTATTLTVIAPGVNFGASAAWMPGTNFIYLQPGSGRQSLLRFDMTAAGGLGSWTSMENIPSAGAWSPHLGCSMTAANSRIYWFGGGNSPPTGNGFFEFTPPELSGDSDGAWVTRASAPATTFRGGVLCYPGSGDFLYGGNENDFWRYAMPGTTPAGQAADSWLPRTSIPENLDMGASMVAVSPTVLYAMTGNSGGDDKFGLYRFDINPGAAGGGTWTRVHDRPGACYQGGAMTWFSGDTIYAIRGGQIMMTNTGTVDLWRYSISTDRFAGLAKPSGMTGEGSAMASVGDGDTIYRMQGYNRYEFGRYSVSTDTWTSLAETPDRIWQGGSMAWDGGDNLYAVGPSSAPQTFLRYSIAGLNFDNQGADSWTASSETFPIIPTLPASVTAGCQLIRAGVDRLYLFPGSSNSVYHYTISTRQWSSPLPSPPAAMAMGSAAAWPGGDAIFVFRGSASNNATMWAFSISRGQWNVKADGSAFDPSDLPVTVNRGAALCFPGTGRHLFAFSGYASTTSNALWSYTLPDGINPLGVWTQSADAPGTNHDGSTFAYPGSGKYLYASQGNFSRELWRYWLISDPPNDPAPPGQLRLDGVTPFQGISTAETGFVAQADASDPYGEQVRLQVEVRPAGTAFTSPAGAAFVPDGISYFQGAYGPGGMHSVTIPAGSLSIGDYHWQVRAQDDREFVSGWVPYGFAVDFTVRPNAGPVASAPGQFWLSDGASIAPGEGRFNGTSVRFQASLSDADVPDQVRFEVEAVPVGVAFTGTPTAGGLLAANNGTLMISIPLGEGAYHWHGRGVDEWGQPGPWMAFGSNPETDPDFQVFRFGSSNDAGGCGVRSDGGSILLPLLVLTLLARRR